MSPLPAIYFIGFKIPIGVFIFMRCFCQYRLHRLLFYFTISFISHRMPHYKKTALYALQPPSMRYSCSIDAEMLAATIYASKETGNTD